MLHVTAAADAVDEACEEDTAAAWAGLAMPFAQVRGELADGPAGEGLPRLGRAGDGRPDDEVLVVTSEQAGTTSRPLTVRTGRAYLVEPVDHIPDGVLVGLHSTNCAITGTRLPPAEASTIVARR